MPSPSSSVNQILQDYAPPAGAYDEFLGDGQPREHLRPFVRLIDRLGRREFSRRWDQAQRLVLENGFAFKGHVGPDDKPRPWELDAIPLLLPSHEWETVSQALRQRAHVLNLTLRDLYGEQTLIKRGVLPPDFLFAHPGFLQAYHGQQVAGDQFLHFYAADIARSPDGEWWVLNDRTEAPSGVGYALENRIVVSRMLPDIFQQCQVQRLAPFFIAAHETLRNLAPQHRDNPRVVLLSHGPTSTNYFEDAFLARYLGYTLVQGGDLAVRNRQVMLKTLGGLLPVDVVLRRQNSNDCDPLDLAATSGFGVPGLTQAVRAGNVGIANALGSGIVESQAFMAYMPQLCHALLGEKLHMPGVATWWCGTPDGLTHVLNNLDKLVIQPAFRQRGLDGRARESLAQMPKDELAHKIKANPTAYAAQEHVQRSSTPVWNNQVHAGRLAIRSYLVASGDSYLAMSGALARISSSGDPLEVSIRRGEGSKDVWILSDAPVDHVTLLGESAKSVTLKRSGSDLPSRVADNLFWLGRQLERAGASTRLVRSATDRMVGETRSTSDVELPILLRCLAEQGHIEPGYAVDEMRSQLRPIEQALPEAVFNASHDGCLRTTLDELFRLGSIVRDRLSEDAWRIIRRIDEGFQPVPDDKTDLSDLLGMTNRLVIQLAAFSGMITDSMTRTQAFVFLKLGQRVERSLQLINLIKNTLIPLPPAPGPVFETVLEVADSLMTYRSRYMASLQLAAVLDLLLTDDTSPRSLAYQFVQIADHVEQLPRAQTLPGYSAEQRIAMSLLHSIRMLDIQSVAEAHSLGEHESLAESLADWETQLPRLSEAISHRYLVHSGPAHQLSDIAPQ